MWSGSLFFSEESEALIYLFVYLIFMTSDSPRKEKNKSLQVCSTASRFLLFNIACERYIWNDFNKISDERKNINGMRKLSKENQTQKKHRKLPLMFWWMDKMITIKMIENRLSFQQKPTSKSKTKSWRVLETRRDSLWQRHKRNKYFRLFQNKRNKC